MKVVQTRVDSMRIPSDIGRIPRKIASSFGGFTAEQWKNWVIVYSMFALRGILPQEHYSCWQAFVLSCYFLYGNRAITPNMHLHCHIAECVKDFGPIYGFWLFSFERYNGILGSYPTNETLQNKLCEGFYVKLIIFALNCRKCTRNTSTKSCHCTRMLHCCTNNNYLVL